MRSPAQEALLQARVQVFLAHLDHHRGCCANRDRTVVKRGLVELRERDMQMSCAAGSSFVRYQHSFSCRKLEDWRRSPHVKRSWPKSRAPLDTARKRLLQIAARQDLLCSALDEEVQYDLSFKLSAVRKCTLRRHR
jgi:hypothetical protein